jgi:hypothetical protein
MCSSCRLFFGGRIGYYVFCAGEEEEEEEEEASLGLSFFLDVVFFLFSLSHCKYDRHSLFGSLVDLFLFVLPATLFVAPSPSLSCLVLFALSCDYSEHDRPYRLSRSKQKK